MNKLNNKINIEISRAEALILFDFLSNNSMKLGADIAEQRILSDLECVLEKNLSEILDPTYKSIINQAKKEIMKSLGNND